MRPRRNRQAGLCPLGLRESHQRASVFVAELLEFSDVSNPGTSRLHLFGGLQTRQLGRKLLSRKKMAALRRGELRLDVVDIVDKIMEADKEIGTVGFGMGSKIARNIGRSKCLLRLKVPERLQRDGRRLRELHQTQRGSKRLVITAVTENKGGYINLSNKSKLIKSFDTLLVCFINISINPKDTTILYR
jgi:hypothetical protein